MARDSFDESKNTKKKVTKKKTEVKKPQSSSVTKPKTTTTKADKVASKSTFLGGGAPVQKVEQAVSKPKTVTKPSTQKKQTVTKQDQINQKMYGTTKPNVTTKTQRTKRDTKPVTSSQRKANAEANMNLKQRNIRNTAPVQSRRTATTTAAQRQKNAEANLNLKQTQIQRSTDARQERRAERMAATPQRRANRDANLNLKQTQITTSSRQNKELARETGRDFRNAITDNGAKISKEDDRRARQNQKSGIKSRNETLGIKESATGLTIEGSLRQSIGGHLKSIGDDSNEYQEYKDMLDDGVANGRFTRAEANRALESWMKHSNRFDRYKGWENTKQHETYQKIFKKGEEIYDKGTQQVQSAQEGAGRLKKAYLGALGSGVGMATDMAAGPAWMAAMASRTYGGEIGNAEKEGATRLEDRRYAGLQALKEVGTEGMFSAIGLSAGLLKGRGLFDSFANRLTGRVGESGIRSALRRYGLGIAEENLEEVAGWALDPAIKNLSYGNALWERQSRQTTRDEGDELRNAIASMDENSVRAMAAHLNSSSYLKQISDEMIANGATKEEASKMALAMQGYMNAVLSNNKEAEAAYEDRMVELLKGSNPYKAKLSPSELWDTLSSTTLLTGVTGLGGAVSTAAMGNAIKESNGLGFVKSMSDVVKLFDIDNSVKGQAVSDHIAAGNDVAGTQVSDIADKFHKVKAEGEERYNVSNQLKDRNMKRENLLIQPRQQNPDGTYSLGKVTDFAYDEYIKEALDFIENSGLDVSQEDAAQIADAYGAYKTGVINPDQMFVVNTDNPVARTVFSELADINFDSFTVRDRKGNVDIARTNIATENALYAKAADNYLGYARLEQENWNDEARGQVQKAMSERGQQTMSNAEKVDGHGDIAMTNALETVDPRDRGKFMLMATAASNVYNDARYRSIEWDEAKYEYKEMYKGLDQSALKEVFDAAKTDKINAETKNYGMPVKSGSTMNKQSLQDVGPVRVPGKVIDMRNDQSIKLSEKSLYYTAAPIFGADFTLVDDLPMRDAQGKVVYRNIRTGEKINEDKLVTLNIDEQQMYEPVQLEGSQSSTGIVLNTNAGVRRNIEDIAKHETIHQIRTNAPEQFKQLARYLQDKLYSSDSEGFMNTIKAKQEQYKVAGQDLTVEGAMEELIAEGGVGLDWEQLIEDIQTDPNIQEKRTLLESIRDAFREVIAKLRAILSSGNVISEEAREATLDELLRMDEGYKLLVKAAYAAKADEAQMAIDEWQDKANKQNSPRLSVPEYTQEEMDAHRQTLVDEVSEYYDSPYTDNYAEAGFVFPDGQMLRMGMDGQRGEDHRIASHAYDDISDREEALNSFINEGNIRWMPEMSTMEFGTAAEPTAEQYEWIRNVARNYSTLNGMIRGIREIDFTDADGETIESKLVNNKSADAIVNDIKRFYKTGTTEGGSQLSQFRFSITTDKEDFIKGANLSKDLRDWAKEMGLDKLSKQPIKGPVIVSVRDLRTAWYEKNGRNDEANVINTALDKIGDSLTQLVGKYQYIDLGDALNAAVTYRTDAEGKPTSVILSCQVKNAEYEVNFDFTTICAKRLAMQKILERFIKTEGERQGTTLYDELKLDEEGLYKLRLILETAGFDVSCRGCFVEQNRYSQQNQARTIANDWNAALDDWARENGTEVIENFGLTTLDIDNLNYEEIEAGFERYHELMKGKKTDVATKNRMLIEASPFFRKRMNASDYASMTGQRALMAIGESKKGGTNLYGLLKRGQSDSKQSVPFTAYNGEISLLPDNMKGKSLYDYLLSIGGARAQSASDFQIEFVYDYMQMVADLSARGLPMHMYTKVIELAELFGMTGIKINLSAMCDVAEDVGGEYAGLKLVDGKYEYNISDQSIDYPKAVELQKRDGYSKNIGIIMVTLSSQHMLKSLDDPDVRYIIGYHSSAMPVVVANMSNMGGATDYTKINKTNKLNEKGQALFDEAMAEAKGNTELEKYKDALRIFDEKIQEETAKKKKKPRRGNEYGAYMSAYGNNTADFNTYDNLLETKDARKTADKYLEHCMENGLIPIYFPFAFHENYYKCEVYDFNMYDNNTGEYAPMEGVQNIYPGLNMAAGETDTTAFTERVSQMMDAQNRTNKALDSQYDAVFDEAKNTLKYSITGDDYMDFDASGIDHNELTHRADAPMTAEQQRDADYMAAVESGNMDEAQRLVDEAARVAGFDTPLLHHGTPSFGFTTFDLARGENIIFATDSRLTAETYSGETSRNRISEKSKVDIDQLYGQGLLDKAKQHLSRYKDYRLMSGPEKEDLLDEARSDMASIANDVVGGFIAEHRDAFDEEKLGIANRIVDSLNKISTAWNDDDVQTAWDDFQDAIWDLKWADESIQLELSREIQSGGALQFLKNRISDFMYAGDLYARGDSTSEYVYDNQLALELGAELNKGIYELYGNPGKQLVIDANGSNWNQIIPPDELGLYGPQRTRSIAEAAKAKGYDSVLFKDLRDNGGATAYNGESDVYMFFNPNQVKSADPVTYREDGSVIPLSERFDPTNNDIRYSLPTQDSDGKILTDGQMEYFRNSQARDIFGRLVPVYHATDMGGFTIFDPMKADDYRSLFFTNKRDVANTYVEDKYLSDEDRIGSDDNTEERSGYYQVYLNLENPLIIEGHGQPWNDIVDGGSVFPAYSYVRVRDASWYREDAENSDEMYAIGQRLRNGDDSRAKAEELSNSGLIEIEIFDGEEKHRSMISSDAESIGMEIANIFGIDDLEIVSGLAENIALDLEIDNSVRFDATDMRNTIGEYGYDTREWAEFAEDEGHDGVIFRNIIDIDDKTEMFDSEEEAASDVYVAFSSNQVKDINNENPTENPDIRFSIATRDEVSAYLMQNAESITDIPLQDARLEENRIRYSLDATNFENSIIASWDRRERNLAEEVQETPLKNELIRLMKQVRKDSGTDRKYSTETIEETIRSIKKMYYFAKGDKAKEYAREAWDAAERIVDDIDYNDELYKQYQGITDYFASYRINLSEDLYDAFGNYKNDEVKEDFEKFVKDNSGKIRFSWEHFSDRTDDIELHYAYGILSKEYPDLFPSDIDNPIDMLLQMDYVLNLTDPYRDAYTSEEHSKLVEDIANSLCNIVDEGNEYKATVDDLNVKAMKQRHREAILKVKEIEKQKRDNQIRRAELWKARYNERIKQDKADKEAGKQKQNEKKLVGDIEKNIKWLSDRLRPETRSKDNAIPEQFRSALAGLLAEFDLQSKGSKKIEKKKGYPSKTTLKLKQLRDQYAAIAKENDDDGNNVFRYNGDLLVKMDELIKTMEGLDKFFDKRYGREVTIADLSLSEMFIIDTMLKSLVHQFREYKNVTIESKRAEIAGVSSEVIGDMDTQVNRHGAAREGGALGKVNGLLNMAEVTPIYFFKRLGAMYKMYRELRRGFDKYIENDREVIKRLSKIMSGYYNKKNPGTTIESWRTMEDAQTFNFEYGSVTLSVAQMMEVYLYANRPQAFGHMIGDGIIVTPISPGGKIATAKEKLLGHEPMVDPVRLTYENVQEIISKLSEEQVNMANKLQELVAGYMSDLGNETTMKLYGYKMFDDPNYFGIHVSQTATNSSVDAPAITETIKNFGWTKPLTPGAKNTIVIGDIFTDVARYCNEMNQFNAYAVPVSDFMRVYNYKLRDEDGTLKGSAKSAIIKAFGNQAHTYIMNFLRDLNGASMRRNGGLEGMIDSALGKAKKAAVFMNMRVALQQPTAIVRALAQINARYFVGVRPSRKATQEMIEHCPIAQWKAWGFYDTHFGRDVEDLIMNNWSKTDVIGSALYGALDNMTWGMIWQAVKKEVEAKQPALDKGSPAYWEACNRRASEVFDSTQVVDSPFHRSDAMRSKDTLVKQFTSFQAEPTLSFNVVRDFAVQAYDAVADGDKSKAAKLIAKGVEIWTLQAAVVAVAQSLWDAVRHKDPDGDDDEDEGFLELWWQNFMADFVDDLKFYNNIYFLKEFTPYAEKLVDYMKTGKWDTYDSNKLLMFQGAEKMTQGMQQFIKKIQKGDEYKHKNGEPYTWYEVMTNFLGGVGYLTGMPIGTVMRDAQSILKWFHINVFAADGTEEKTKAGLMDAIANKMGYQKAGSGNSEESSTYSQTADDLPDNLTDEQKQEILKAGEKRAEKNASKGTSNGEKVDYDELTYKAMKAAAGLEGEEYDKKVYSVIANGLKDYAQNANYYELSKMRDAIEAAGGDVNYFDQQVVKNSKTAFKKSIKADMTPDEVNQQALLYHYLVTHGVSQEEISSEIVYKSELAKDMKVAFRIGDEETINEALEPLAQAGILQEDLDRLWTNRNRIDLTKYKENGGRYSDRLKSMGTFIWPTDGVITSHFGYRNAPTAGASSNHPAIDIGAPQGTAVVAADGGVVISAGANGGYGNSVGIKHDNGMITWYNHLYSWNVKVGDTVAQGQQIAQVGSTGISTGPHLDFKIMDTNGNPVDPEKYLATR